MQPESSTDAPAAQAPPAEALPAPSSSTDTVPSAAATRHKRPRAAVDPGTPKGDEGEPRGLSTMTPLAKKGRVEGEEDAGSDNDLTTPPPSTDAAGDASSRPSTPAHASSAAPVPGTEGKEARHIRERVAAMKPPGQGEGETQEEDEADVPEKKQDTIIADVAAEVSDSAAVLGDQQEAKEEKDVEIAEIAAEVGRSAESVDAPKTGAAAEGGDSSQEAQDAAKTAAEVGEAVAPVQAEDEKIADAAAETAEAAKDAPEPTPASMPKAAPVATGSQPTFSSYSATASPFSAFSSTASPFASVSTPVKPVADKPKPKGAFAASPFLSSSIPPAAKPSIATSSTISSATAIAPFDPAVKAAAAASAEASPSPAKPSAPPATPSFTKAAATTNLASASPFSAFASTSGFASATKPAGGAGASAFSAFSAAPSAFSSVPSTPLGKSAAASGKSALDEAKESGSDKPAGGAEGEDDDGEKKPVFTEQERFTGEEEEEVVHQVRCKVFVMEEGQWKERGTGPLRMNQSRKAAEGEKLSARLVMRADATHRLLLNAPLFPEFFIEVSNEKYVRFTVIEGAEPVSYMLRTGNAAAAETLVQAVRDKVATL
ncbi:hypothetical protein JCM11251_002159 [Rhodosporidiobolus azoricus]